MKYILKEISIDTLNGQYNNMTRDSGSGAKLQYCTESLCPDYAKMLYPNICEDLIKDEDSAVC